MSNSSCMYCMHSMLGVCLYNARFMQIMIISAWLGIIVAHIVIKTSPLLSNYISDFNTVKNQYICVSLKETWRCLTMLHVCRTLNSSLWGREIFWAEVGFRTRLKLLWLLVISERCDVVVGMHDMRQEAIYHLPRVKGIANQVSPPKMNPHTP